MPYLIMIGVVLFLFILAFCITYTIISVVIMWRHRERKKYQFNGMDNIRAKPETALDKSEIHSAIDHESAKTEWDRKNGPHESD